MPSEETERLWPEEPTRKPRRERPRDELWDILTDEFGEPRTADERGRRNRAVKQLRDAETTPEELRIVIDFCNLRFRDYTEMALCGWLTRALREQGTQDNIRELFKRIEGGG